MSPSLQQGSIINSIIIILKMAFVEVQIKCQGNVPSLVWLFISRVFYKLADFYASDFTGQHTNLKIKSALLNQFFEDRRMRNYYLT